jgi:hypothetical protein
MKQSQSQVGFGTLDLPHLKLKHRFGNITGSVFFAAVLLGNTAAGSSAGFMQRVDWFTD